MIIPTPKYNPMFADDGVPFRTKMTNFILQEFTDVPGGAFNLLHGDEAMDSMSGMLSDEDDDIFREKKNAA